MASETKLEALIAYWGGVEKSAQKRVTKAQAKQKKYRKQLREMRHEPEHISKRGLELIAQFEGFSPIPYNDPAGHATIGYGHLLHKGSVTADDKRRWGTLTKGEGLDLLRKDVRGFENGVKDAVKIKLNQHELDALVSFAFNVGLGALRTSTLLKKLNAGDRKGAADQFGRWVNAGSPPKPMAGLVRRREAERKLFLS